MTTDALLAVAELPYLVDLTLHAEHLNPEELSSGLGDGCFPSLSKLRLRAKSATIVVLVSALQKDKLNWLWLEAQDISYTDVKWDNIAELITTKASDSLQFLGLEHHIEFMHGDVQVPTPTSSNTPVQPPPASPASSLSIFGTDHVLSPRLTLKSFNKLHKLQALQVEMTIPPSFSEQDITDLSRGCPALTLLDLGGTSCFEHGIMSNLTESTFRCFQRFQNLERLVLPSAYTMDQMSPIPADAPTQQHALRSLTLGNVSAKDGAALTRHLTALFPSLENIEGAPVQDELWALARVELSRLQT